METIFTDGQLTKLIELMRQKGMTVARLTKLLGSGILADVLDPEADLGNREAVRAALNLGAVTSDIFRFAVDYDRTLEQMIAAGQYDWHNVGITAKCFPVKGEGVVTFEARYFHFNRSISSGDAIKEMEAEDPENPWAPAKIEHTLSHGKAFPDEQRKYPIIGLGSVATVFGSRGVPYLGEDGSGRRLSLFWFDDGWRPRCRFLAVREVSEA